MADHDPLTGLPNRRKFETELERHIAHVTRYGSNGALLMIDLDHFKSVNDTRGHDAGDRLITAIAGLLKARVRASDIFARLGGDEFGVLLPQADRPSRAPRRRVADAVAQHGAAGGRRTNVTASIGIAMFDNTTNRPPAKPR